MQQDNRRAGYNKTALAARIISGKTLRALLLIGISYYILQPWIFLVFRSFMDRMDMYRADIFIIPRNFTFYNITYVWQLLDFTSGYIGALWYALLNTLLQITSCLLVAYGFARFNFRFKKILFSFVILTIIVPPTTVIINQYIHFLRFDMFGLFNVLNLKPIDLTQGFWVIFLQSITAMGIKNGIFIYLIRRMFERVPLETQEAAIVDGASSFVIFYKVMIPAVTAGIISCALLIFVWTWNDRFLVSWFGPGRDLLIFRIANVPEILGITAMGQNISYVMELTQQVYILLTNVASFLYIVPLIILYVIAQRHFVEGIERSGIVG
jgi:multiple sugar transport system permease protein